MKRVSKAVGIFMLYLSMILILNSTGNTQVPRRGGDLMFHPMSIPPHFNSAIQSGWPVMVTGAQLFASLVEFDDKWQPVPYLANSWKISDDNLKYTFHLVESATFHDGKPITSEDIAFSFKTVKENHPFGRAMFDSVDRVETPTPHTAVFVLKKPNSAMMISLSPVLMPVIPKHIYSTGPIRTHPANLRPIGSGPFRFGDYKQGDYYILERYEKYFRPGLPYLDRIIGKAPKDPSAVEVAIRQGDFHYVPRSAGMRLQNIARLKNINHLAVTDRGYEAFGPLNFLQFNLRKPLFKDVRVRRAIAHAIDKDFIAQKLHQGLSVKATGPIPQSSPFYTTDVRKYDFDLGKANKLLDEAGHPRGAGGVRFSSTLDWYPGDLDHQQMLAEYLKPALGKIGIDIELRPPPDMGTYAKRIKSWEYDLAMSGIGLYGDPVIGVHRSYLCENITPVLYTNDSGYCNPKLDEIMAKAGSEMDFTKRKILYAEFQKILTEDLPLIWTNEIHFFTVYHKELHGVPMGIWGAMAPWDKMYWKEGKPPK